MLTQGLLIICCVPVHCDSHCPVIALANGMALSRQQMTRRKVELKHVSLDCCNVSSMVRQLKFIAKCMWAYAVIKNGAKPFGQRLQTAM